jgi:hypothetical protein
MSTVTRPIRYHKGSYAQSCKATYQLPCVVIRSYTPRYCPMYNRHPSALTVLDRWSGEMLLPELCGIVLAYYYGDKEESIPKQADRWPLSPPLYIGPRDTTGQQHCYAPGCDYAAESTPNTSVCAIVA